MFKSGIISNKYGWLDIPHLHGNAMDTIKLDCCEVGIVGQKPYDKKAIFKMDTHNTNSSLMLKCAIQLTMASRMDSTNCTYSQR